MRFKDFVSADGKMAIVNAFLSIALIGVIFYADAMTPYADTHWLFYIVPLLLAYRTRHIGFVLLVLAGIVACGIVGGLLTRGQEPPKGPAFIELVNRLEGLLVLVGFTVLLIRLSKAKRAAPDLSSASATTDERVRKMLECSPDAITITDLTGKIVDCGQATLDLHGYVGRNELLGRSALELIAQADHAKAMAIMARTMETGLVRNVEYTMLRKDGSTFPAELSASTIVDGQGRPTAFVAVTKDISERKQAEGALRQSNEKLSKIVQTSPDAITITRVSDGVYLEVSQSFADITGYSREEVLGRSSLPNGSAIWTRAADRERMVAELRAHGQVIGMEALLRMKNGDTRTVLISARLLEMQGEPCILSIARDITERKRLESALQEREQQYRLVSELATDYIFRLAVAPDGKVTMPFVSDNFYALTGRTRQDVLTVDLWSKVIHPEDLDKVRTLLGRMLAKPQSSSLECRSFVHGGRQRWVEIFARSEWDEKAGRVASIVGAVKDITQRKHAEDEVLAEKERLAVTLASIADAVVATDALGRVTLMNKVAEDLTGWPLQEAAGRPLGEIFKVINEQTREPIENPAAKVLASGEIVDLAIHTCLVHRDGHERFIADSAAPIKDKDGKTLGVVLVFRDTTQERKVAETMQRTARLDSLGVLAGGIAHDFNNLLTGIYGYIELARFSSKDAQTKEHLSETLSTLNRARALTMQLLTFAKGGAPIRKIMPLSPHLRESVRFALSGSIVACDFTLPENLWATEIDKNQIGQVIDNIVINALQAMPNGGTLKVMASNAVVGPTDVAGLAPGDYVRISFQDSGIGIPKDVLPHIFDPFYTTKTKGHGLGLATCHSIVTRHDGFIEAESQPGKGSVFRVYLPATKQAASGDQPLLTQHRGEGLMIVVDDEEVVRKAVGKMLEGMGYVVIGKQDGKAALEFFAGETQAGRRVTGMLCDLTIRGGMGGKETIAEVRKLNQEIPIFVMSGYADDDVMKSPGNYGFAGSIAKPFSSTDLAVMLARPRPLPG